MKIYIIYLTCLVLHFTTLAQDEENNDPVAVLILDRMNEVIGDLGCCSFTLYASSDMQDNTFFLSEDSRDC